ncbi:MAG: hypothetical protein FWD39_00970 [Clostridiales bacterium]|nr:hypothetical protein [Clostridiales bacterium]
MKTLRKILIAAVLLSLCFALAACTGKAPQTKDTSAVAGVYFQHDAENNLMEGKKMVLNADGTWTTGEGSDKISHTFTVEGTIDGTKIEIYFGTAKYMYGTLEEGKLELRVFSIVTWVDAVFYKEGVAPR